MQAGDPFAPFFGALQHFNELLLSDGPAALAENYRRNLESIEQANRIIMDGALEASRRQSEILRRTMDDIAEAARGVTCTGSPTEPSEIQTKLVQQAVTVSIERMREINDTLARANGEALELLRDRLLSSFHDALGNGK